MVVDLDSGLGWRSRAVVESSAWGQKGLAVVLEAATLFSFDDLA